MHQQQPPIASKAAISKQLYAAPQHTSSSYGHVITLFKSSCVHQSSTACFCFNPAVLHDSQHTAEASNSTPKCSSYNHSLYVYHSCATFSATASTVVINIRIIHHSYSHRHRPTHWHPHGANRRLNGGAVVLLQVPLRRILQSCCPACCTAAA